MKSTEAVAFRFPHKPGDHVLDLNRVYWHLLFLDMEDFETRHVARFLSLNRAVYPDSQIAALVLPGHLDVVDIVQVFHSDFVSVGSYYICDGKWKIDNLSPSFPPRQN